MGLLSGIAGGILVTAGLFLIGINYARQFVNFRSRKDPDSGWSSPVPFLGPLLVVAGYAMLPLAFPKWLFVAFVVDPDTVLTTINIPVAMWCSYREHDR